MRSASRVARGRRGRRRGRPFRRAGDAPAVTGDADGGPRKDHPFRRGTARAVGRRDHVHLAPRHGDDGPAPAATFAPNGRLPPIGSSTSRTSGSALRLGDPIVAPTEATTMTQARGGVKRDAARNWTPTAGATPHPRNSPRETIGSTRAIAAVALRSEAGETRNEASAAPSTYAADRRRPRHGARHAEFGAGRPVQCGALRSARDRLRRRPHRRSDPGSAFDRRIGDAGAARPPAPRGSRRPRSCTCGARRNRATIRQAGMAIGAGGTCLTRIAWPTTDMIARRGRRRGRSRNPRRRAASARSAGRTER